MKYETPKGNVVFINDGYKLILRGFFGKLFYGVHEYTAVEIHFHHPSEHTVRIFLINSSVMMKKDLL